MSWESKYVGIPFKSDGYDFDGVSCWGLACLIYSRELGIDLPKNSSRVNQVLSGNPVNASLFYDILKPVKEVQPFDLVHMHGIVDCGGKLRMLPLHVGIVIDGNRFIHAQHGVNSHIGSYKQEPYKKRVIGFYRYE